MFQQSTALPIFRLLKSTQQKPIFFRTQRLHNTCSQDGNNVRVRYAPSPTGSLHLGGLRTALYNYIFARKFDNGKCLLRVEDTDRTRLVPGAVEQLLRDLEWSGLIFDEGPAPLGGSCGPYTQSERLDIYTKYANQLLQDGHAYRCFCTSERLEELRKNQATRGVPTVYDRICSHLTAEEIQERLEEGQSSVIRMKIPESGTTIVNDAIRGEVVFQNRVIDDQVLMKSDGFPTYHLANIVDDHLMGITHVIRGEEWIPSAGKHVLLYKMFGWDAPTFAHLPLLLREDGSKLSKRFKDSSLDYYITKGYLPEAIINFVALLGWHPPHIANVSNTNASESESVISSDSRDSLRAALDADIPIKKAKAKKAIQENNSTTTATINASQSEMLTMDELISLFSLEKVQKGGAAVELHKLQYFHNQYYMKLLETNINRLVQFVLPQVKRAITEYKQTGFDLSDDIENTENIDNAFNLDLLNGVEYSHLIIDTDTINNDEYMYEIIKKALRMTHDHPCLLPEFPMRTFFIYARPNLTSGAATSMRPEVWKDTTMAKVSTNTVLENVCQFIETTDDDILSSPSKMVSQLKALSKQTGVGLREVYLPLRYCLSGTSSGPGVADQIVALGREEVLLRIKAALALDM